MTNYDPYEQDREDNAVNESPYAPGEIERDVQEMAMEREDNAVGQHDEDFGEQFPNNQFEMYQEALNGKWDLSTKYGPRNMDEPKAYDWEWEPDAIDRKNRLIRAQAAVAHYQAMNPKLVTHNQWLGIVGLGLLILCAITFGLLLIPPAHGQERLPAFESQFQWAQLTWDKSENQWCIDAQPKDAGPGEMVGSCAETLQDAKRAVMALPDMPEPKASQIAPHGPLEPTVRPYWTTTNGLLVSSMVGVGAFDLAQTCHNLANGGHEDWMPMKSCGSLVGVGIAMGLGMTYLSYQLHRHGHYKLEKIPFIGMIAGNTAGISYSKKNGAW